MARITRGAMIELTTEVDDLHGRCPFLAELARTRFCPSMLALFQLFRK
jgi:hypothetical protein